MIIPNKNIRLRNSLLGMGTQILSELYTSETVSSLWEKIKKSKEINSFEKFILTLDFLFIMNLIKFEDGVILKVNQ